MVVVGATLLVCLTLPLLGSVSSLPMLVVALLAFGAGLGAQDVAMNIQAIIVERASLQPMMSGFHGLFSLGGIAAAPLASPRCWALGHHHWVRRSARRRHRRGAWCGCAACARAGRSPSAARGRDLAWPRGIVLFIGVLCFIGFLSEGAVLDWSAVFLTSVRGMAPSYAGLGYAAFALTMTVGRLVGDRIVRRVGGSNVINAGAMKCVSPRASRLRRYCWGGRWRWPGGNRLLASGSCNIVPVLFTGAGRQTVMAEAVAVPAIKTLGYAGILAGPAAIGFVAQVAGLSAAFLILAVLLLGVAASGRLLRL